MKHVKPRCLEEAEIATALLKLKGWSGDQNGLRKKLLFGDFRGAMQFMQACVAGIEQRDHHPAWCNTYNTVTIQLNTHSAGNRVTEKDIDLAEFIDSILSDAGLDLLADQ